MLIKALSSITVPAGVVLSLTDEQLSARSHAVTAIDDGHRLTHDQQFKKGEELRVVGSLPICIHDSLYEVVEDEKPAKTGKTKAKQAAAADTDAIDTAEQPAAIEPSTETAEQTPSTEA